MVGVGLNGPRLPTPREVSRRLNNLQLEKRPQQISHMTMQWGQFIDHDMSLTPESEGNYSEAEHESLRIFSGLSKE